MTNKFFKLIISKILISFMLIIPVNSSMESNIVLKINNEIITNFDIDEEYRYLKALNNDLKNLDEASLKRISKNSIIREKIKKNEIIKYFELDHTKEYLSRILKNFYLKLDIQTLEQFENHLAVYNLSLDDVKKKLEIEVLWNDLIRGKFKNQININEQDLRKKIRREELNKNLNIRYDLSEILFQATDEVSLTEIKNKIKESIISSGFKNTANIYSISDTAKFGGHIGWIDENQLSEEFRKSLKGLNVDGITQAMNVPNGFLILKIDNKEEEKINLDEEKILKSLIDYEKQKQYNQFSLIYYNKIKLNNKISE